jgi:hypothetical protein
MLKPFPRRLVLVVLFCTCAGLAWALPHPFHTSVAELDWNSTSQRWEVSIRIHAGDLELALAQQCRRQIDVEDKEALPVIQEYLASRFVLLPHSDVENWAKRRTNAEVETTTTTSNDNQLQRPKSGEVPSGDSAARNPQSAETSTNFEWVGHELEGNWLWLYFEIDQPKLSEQPLALFSQLLTEVNEDQINIVSFRTGGKRISRQTNRQLQWIALESNRNNTELSR